MSRCESCGMPFSKDPKGGGIEKDGTLSTRYCSLCYSGGEFYYKGDDVKEYQKMVLDIMTKNGWWRPLAWLMTREIPRLPRWKK